MPPLPTINIPTPKVALRFPREQLPARYLEVLALNPALARIEGEARTIGFTAEETRTVQLLIACASNNSLLQRLTELETALGQS